MRWPTGGVMLISAAPILRESDGAAQAGDWKEQVSRMAIKRRWRKQREAVFMKTIEQTMREIQCCFQYYSRAQSLAPVQSDSCWKNLKFQSRWLYFSWTKCRSRSEGTCAHEGV